VAPATPLPRRVLTTVWWSATAPLTVAGVACAFLLVGTGAALALTGFAGGVTALAAGQQPRRAPLDRDGASIAAVGLLVGVWLLGVIGFVAAIGAAGLGICALVAATGGLLLRGPRRGGAATRADTGRRADPPAGPALERVAEDRLPPLASLPGLSTADVCWAWRLSYPRIRRPGCPGYQLDDLARLRCACLEELERRDPVAFHRWLPTARAAGDPARVFCRQAQQR
jgi:hypothetical protein